MKIQVHELEGDYYCAIDDIARFRAFVTKRSTTALEELERAYEILPLFWHIHTDLPRLSPALSPGLVIPDNPTQEERRNRLYTLIADVFYEPVNNGIYQVSNTYFLANYGDGFFRINRFNDNETRPQRIEIDMINIDTGMRQEDRKVFNYDGAKLHSNRPINDRTDSPFPIVKSNAKDLYILASDAEIYLAKIATSGDFIASDHYDEIIKEEELREKAMQTQLDPPPPYIVDTAIAEYKAEIGELVEEIPTEQQDHAPYLDKAHASHAPLLAVAVDIWERLFIHGEGNQNQGLEPRTIDLVEKYYPALTTDKEKKSIAYIATSHLGKTEKSKKNENNG